MKNSDPPHPTRHNNGNSPRIKLTPELHRFIQHMGGYFEGSGVPRIGGLILGLLIIAHEPLSAEQIASILKISRASVSTNFRILAAGGLAERFTSHDDRVTYYSFPADGWVQMLRVSEVQTLAFKRIVEEGLAAVPRQDVVRQRLALGNEMSDLLLEVFRKAADKWRTRSASASASTR